MKNIRRTRAVERRLYVEALEIRTLLSAYLIPFTNHTDLIYDPVRNQLDVPTSTGIVQRFDVATKTALGSLTVGGKLGAGDITNDGSALYFTDTGSLTLRKYSFTSGTASAFTYVGDSLESAGYDLAMTSGGIAVFDGQFAGSGWVPLRTVDPSTDTLDKYVPDPYPNNQVRQNTHIYRSADGSTLYFAESNSSAGPLSVYDSATRTVTARTSLNVSLSNALGAASRDGSQVAINISGTITIRDRNFSVLATNLPAGAMTYSPTRDRLYILPTGSTTLQAYDTNTFALVASFDVGETYSMSGPGTPMIMSADGTTLFVATATGVRMQLVDESHIIPVTLTSAVSTPINTPLPVTITLTNPSIFSGTIRVLDGSLTLGSISLTGTAVSMTVNVSSTGSHNLTATFVDGTIGSISTSNIDPVVALPVTATSGLISLAEHRDIIYDATRNQLDIVANNGNLFRYDLTTERFVSAVHMTGTPGRGDITVDGNFLYLTDLSGTTIHKVNLNTNAVTDLNYNGGGLENAAYDLAVVSDNKAIFDSQFAGSGWVTVRSIDLTTDVISSGTVAVSSVRQDTGIFRSADRGTLLFAEGNISSGPLTVYDAINNLSVSSLGTNAFLSGPIGAVSRDGSLIACKLSTTMVFDRNLKQLANLPAGAIAFSPVRDLLYVLPSGATSVSVYDTTTFALKGSFDLGQAFTSGTDTGIITLTSDGNRLLVTTTNGIREVNVTPLTIDTASTLTVSSYNITAGQAITLSAKLTSAGAAVGGSFRFYDGTALLATVALNASNSASFSTVSLTAGIHNLTARYFNGQNANGVPSSIATVIVTSAASPANLLPITDHTDLIFDASRHELIIPSSNGNIYRYDVVAKKFLSTFYVVGKPGYADITEDNQFLYVTDQDGTTVHKVDLNTGSVTDLTYNAGFYEGGGWDLAIGSGRAVFDGQFNGSGWVDVRTIDLATDTLGTSNAIGQVRQNTTIFRSGDRSTVVFAQSNISSGPLSVYDPTLNSVIASVDTGRFLGGPQAAVNADGSLIALATGSSLTLYDRSLSVKTLSLPGGPVGFNPASGTLYVIPTGTANLRAYDPVTFTLKATYAVGQNVAIDSSRNGIIAFSPDGTTAYITTTSGIRSVTLNEGLVPAATLTASAGTISPGSNLILTATDSSPLPGVIRFQEGNNILATVTTASGFAGFTINSLSIGTHNFTAIFVDAAGRVAGPSNVVTVSVIPQVPTLALTVTYAGSPTTPPTLHVTASGSPVGVVDLKEGDTILATATLVNGAADLTPAHPLSLGAHSLNAYFEGNAFVATASSPTVTLGINQGATTTALSSSSLTVPEDKIFTLTATVAGASATPLGTVTFLDGDTPLATRTVNASGVATLNLSLPISGTHHLTARYNGSADYLGSTSDTVDEEVLRVAKKLLYVDPITTAAAGSTFDLKLAVVDNQNLLVSDFTGSISIAVLAMNGGGVLGGTLSVPVVDGYATFTGLSISAPGTYALRATDGKTLFADLPGLVITAPATKLAFVTLPASAVAGQLIPRVAVQFLDNANHVVPIDGPTTISLSKAGPTLSGTLTVNASQGTAIFDDLSMTKTGSYAFSVSYGSLKATVSKAFTIVPDAASSRLALDTLMVDLPLDKAIPTISVSVKDQFGNLVTTDTSTMTLSINSGPENATLKGNLTAKVSKGVAKFSNIVPLMAGNYTLKVSDGDLAPVTTNSFNVVYVPTKLAVTVPTGAGSGPTLPPLVVRVLDAKGRLVTTSTAPITISVTSPRDGILHGTLTVNAVAGVATFSDLSVDNSGVYSFKFVSGKLTLATMKLTVAVPAPPQA